MKVPFNDLARSMPRDEVWSRVREVLEDGRYISGPEVAAFEREFARYCGAGHCVGVSSGTTALQAALLAFGVGPGDEVITVSATFMATTAAIVHVGAVPVFVDIDPRHRTMRVDAVEPAVTSRTRAIVAVDLYGHPSDIGPITEVARRHGLTVICDAAQAHGASYHGRRVGSLADATTFSFYPSKNLGAVGDAGAVTTDRADIADRIRELRDHGRRADRDDHVRVGYNWRLDAVQAAVLRVRLRHLDGCIRARREAAARYGRLLARSHLDLPTEATGVEHAYHLYVVSGADRTRMRAALRARGIATAVHYPTPVHLLPPMRPYAPADHSRRLAVTEALARECLSLPMFPGITAAEQAAVADAVHEAESSARRVHR
ncbi:DegT/DnrJ/EryC1/StrS family aminotransferase [Microbispora triticiradicis]|uniref:DegT/DnrJ/EryC1/StrS family aminotransferase n=2 Tax=Microbispora triticiradicis TaxID=2200763 RepID=A0ABX9LPH8_9ACTN|nr:DegT/DnrJ/EryC1/StrS family aminotransferase [Microbispora triticiradicis]